MQAERYDLSKQVSELRAQKHKDGTYSFGYIPPEGGNRRMLRTFVPDNEIEGLVGKELADKIRSQKQETVDYSGLDLNVGGGGMGASMTRCSKLRGEVGQEIRLKGWGD